MSDIADAIDAAAGDRDDQISADPRRVNSASRRTRRARATISRFLDNVDDRLTVFELREMLEESRSAASS